MPRIDRRTGGTLGYLHRKGEGAIGRREARNAENDRWTFCLAPVDNLARARDLGEAPATFAYDVGLGIVLDAAAPLAVEVSGYGPPLPPKPASPR